MLNNFGKVILYYVDDPETMTRARVCAMSVQRQGQQSSSRSVVLSPYTVERRDVSENIPPEAQEISLEQGFCTPRPERLPEGNLEGYTV